MTGMEKKNYGAVCDFNLEKQSPVDDRSRCPTDFTVAPLLSFIFEHW